MIEITNECNMELMSRYPDNHFDLAIVDPPYGSDNIKGGYTSGKGSSKGAAKQKGYNNALWKQDRPNEAYFKELVRVSKNQIIWGANHFASDLPFDSSGWIFWDKLNDGISFSDGELAWSSFNKALRRFVFMWNGMIQGDMKNKQKRIHPTQKPIQLYTFLFQNYAKEGDKILDTHIGSGSIAIAVDNANKIDKMNLSLTGCELDKDYYTATMKRIKEQTNWQSLF